jgi:hypothetical protein
MPFAIPPWPTGKATAQGTTDAAGRTGEFVLDKTEVGRFTLVQRVGDGKYGEVLSLRWSFDNAPVRTWYEIRGCKGSTPYRGFTDKDGNSVYYTDKAPCRIDLVPGDKFGSAASPRTNSRPYGR